MESKYIVDYLYTAIFFAPFLSYQSLYKYIKWFLVKIFFMSVFDPPLNGGVGVDGEGGFLHLFLLTYLTFKN
jgi:hypothetical protein